MSERTTFWVLLVVLLAQLVLLTLQLPGETDAERSLLEEMTLRALAPFPRAVSFLADGVDGAKEGFVTRRALTRDNERLRTELEEARQELFRLRNAHEEVERLAAAFEYTPQIPGRLRPVEVVYLDASSWLRTLILFVGEREAEIDQPVVTPDGLLGRVVEVAGPYAKVQMISDRAAAASAMLARTRRQGIARGGGEALELDFLPLQASVEVGDRVVTAGTDGIYPRGIPIGTVSSVETGGELFHEVEIRPAVDFGRLDRVFLLERDPVPDELKGTDAGS